MRHGCVTVLIGLALSIPGAVHAQTGAQAGRLREVALSVGPGNLSHGDDRLGWGGTLGGSVTIPITARFAISVDAHRSYGPEPGEQPCGIVNVVCTGVGHHGVRRLTIWSGNGIYYFSSAGVRPYVVGGLNVLHFTFISGVTTVRGAQATITELERDDITMGIAVGGGVRIPLGPRLSVAPEVRIHDGTMLAGANLTQLRTSVSVGYRW